MQRRSLIDSMGAVALIAAMGCQPESNTAPQLLDASIAPLFAASGPNGRPTAWADGELFDALVPPQSFDNPRGNFDELYAGGSGFLGGAPLISESKPGDQDYNGGRWHLNVLKSTVDPSKYANASSVEDLDVADFDSMDVYFECPLLPHRGNGGR